MSLCHSLPIVAVVGPGIGRRDVVPGGNGDVVIRRSQLTVRQLAVRQLTGRQLTGRQLTVRQLTDRQVICLQIVAVQVIVKVIDDEAVFGPPR